MVAGYGGNGKFSEVISIGNVDITCQNFPDGPPDRSGASGGFVQKEVLICGGFHHSGKYFDDCWILGQNKTIKMVHQRGYSPSIVINDKVSNLII